MCLILEFHNFYFLNISSLFLSEIKVLLSPYQILLFGLEFSFLSSSSFFYFNSTFPLKKSLYFENASGLSCFAQALLFLHTDYRCGAWSFGMRLSCCFLRSMWILVPRPGLRTCVPCIARWIPGPGTTREVPPLHCVLFVCLPFHLTLCLGNLKCTCYVEDSMVSPQAPSHILCNDRTIVSSVSKPVVHPPIRPPTLSDFELNSVHHYHFICVSGYVF